MPTTEQILDRLSLQDEVLHGEYAVALLAHQGGGFLVGELDDLRTLKACNPEDMPTGPIFRAIGEGEDQYTERVQA